MSTSKQSDHHAQLALALEKQRLCYWLIRLIHSTPHPPLSLGVCVASGVRSSANHTQQARGLPLRQRKGRKCCRRPR